MNNALDNMCFRHSGRGYNAGCRSSGGFSVTPPPQPISDELQSKHKAQHAHVEADRIVQPVLHDPIGHES